MQANPLSAPDIDSDVLIVGAGPAGLALSVALAQAGLRSTVLEQNDAQTLAQPPEDGRDIALTHRARRILETLNIWQRLPAEEIAPLRKAHVSNGVSPLVLPFDAEGDGHEALGWLVPNHRLREAAYAVAIECPAVRVQPDTRVSGLRRDSSCATLEVDGGPALRAPLVVAADSRFSSLRRMAGIGARMLDFGRTAIVCRVGHEKDHEGIALECFRYGNTLAVLPMAGRLASAVVTLPSDQAPEWLALDATAFAARVQKQLDSRLGAMRLAGERHSYPLVGVYAHRFAAPRFALVGDAAVGMHPVTAHGFNFGLRGITTLAGELRAAHAAGQDIAAPELLARYERAHRRATLPLYLATTFIARLYTTDHPPARLLRDAALRLAQNFPPFKRMVAATLSGRH